MTARLDVELVRRGLARSRAQARELVAQGVVMVDGAMAPKASVPVAEDSEVELTRQPERWVGRAAHKLLGALEVFGPRGLEVRGRRCLDVGASTGGFTQVLLERGASHVTALDVGHDQLVRLVADDPRVTEVSGRNVRDVVPGELGDPFAVVVADLSFISLRVALPAIAPLLAPGGDLVLLVKPQFEVGRDRLGRTGVVTSSQQRVEALQGVVASVRKLGLRVVGVTVSPLRGGVGGDGNREYLVWGSSAPVGSIAVDLDADLEIDAQIRQMEDPP